MQYKSYIKDIFRGEEKRGGKSTEAPRKRIEGGLADASTGSKEKKTKEKRRKEKCNKTARRGKDEILSQISSLTTDSLVVVATDYLRLVTREAICDNYNF